MRPRRLLPILCALVLASPAFGQSSLGGAQNVPPPRQATPAPAPAVTPAPAQRSETRPPVVNPPPRPQATQRNAEGQQRPAAQQQQRPAGQQQSQQRPAGQQQRPAGQQPQAGQGNRAAAGAAAGVAAGAAAGAAATAGAARPPEAATAPAPPPAERAPTTGSVTGLPLPRFAALRSDEVNMRSGPGTRFPIEWTYQRRELPVEILREFELWRRIRDPDGTEGWVHQSTLMGRRSFIVRGAPGSEVMLRRRAEDQAQPVARLRPGVVGRLRACEPTSPWCEAQIGEFRGYIKRADIWGVGPTEEVK